METMSTFSERIRNIIIPTMRVTLQRRLSGDASWVKARGPVSAMKACVTPDMKTGSAFAHPLSEM